MGFSIDGQRSRQKPVNAELNLVPYIDLLTCMVAFLLITAVWTQLASLPISQKGPGTDSDTLPVADEKIAVVVDDDRDLLVGDGQGVAVRAWSFLADGQARELRPHRGDEQERHHAREEIDVGNQIQLRVDRLLATALTVDRKSHGYLRW